MLPLLEVTFYFHTSIHFVFNIISDSQLNVFHVSFELIQFEVRDDEEQKVKLTQTIELLLAAGYFRARIKGLSPFDKVIIFI